VLQVSRRIAALTGRFSQNSCRQRESVSRPSLDSRLVRALAVETHENWLEGTRYLNMDHLVELKKEQMRQLEEAA